VVRDTASEAWEAHSGRCTYSRWLWTHINDASDEACALVACGNTTYGAGRVESGAREHGVPRADAILSAVQRIAITGAP
jgi:hypothetical protein